MIRCRNLYRSYICLATNNLISSQELIGQQSRFQTVTPRTCRNVRVFVLVWKWAGGVGFVTVSISSDVVVAFRYYFLKNFFCWNIVFFFPRFVCASWLPQNAMKAYYNDIQNNPDYSSQVLIKERGISIRPTPRIMNPQPTLNISYSKNNMPVSIKPVPAVKPEYVWHQSKTDDGTNLMYYWNTETGGQYL